MHKCVKKKQQNSHKLFYLFLNELNAALPFWFLPFPWSYKYKASQNAGLPKGKMRTVHLENAATQTFDLNTFKSHRKNVLSILEQIQLDSKMKLIVYMHKSVYDNCRNDSRKCSMHSLHSHFYVESTDFLSELLSSTTILLPIPVWIAKSIFLSSQFMTSMANMAIYTKNATWRWSKPTCQCLVDLQFADSNNQKCVLCLSKHPICWTCTSLTISNTCKM